jgi:hypothetical protein
MTFYGHSMKISLQVRAPGFLFGSERHVCLDDCSEHMPALAGRAVWLFSGTRPVLALSRAVLLMDVHS